jgi:hypothetical protein
MAMRSHAVSALALSAALIFTTSGCLFGHQAHLSIGELSTIAHQVPVPAGVTLSHEQSGTSGNGTTGRTSNEVQLQFTTGLPCDQLQSVWITVLQQAHRRYKIRGTIQGEPHYIEVDGAASGISIQLGPGYPRLCTEPAVIAYER